MSSGAFSRPVLVVAAALGTVSLLAGFAAVLFGAEFGEVRSAGANAYSASAIGHHAFVELLKRSGRTVLVGRRKAASEVGPDALLLCLEPLEHGAWTAQSAERLRAALSGARRALVALPKWAGGEDPEHPGWLAGAEIVPRELPEEVLSALQLEASLLRSNESRSGWDADGFAFEPDLQSAQLLRSSELVPLVAHEGAILVGQLPSEPGVEQLLLADPDLVSNHGLGRGENAALALALVDRLAGPEVPIVVDETLHGLAIEPNVWSELGRFPLVLIVIQAALAAAFLLWGGTRRFGAPVAERGGLGAGKRLLIENTAELLLSGGHSASILGRYVEYNLRRVADAYHLPSGLEAAERRARLAAMRARGGARTELEEIDTILAATAEGGRSRGPELLRAARLARTFREEMLHGTR